MESQKAIGILLYGVERLLKFKDERSEHYIDRYLRGLQYLLYIDLYSRVRLVLDETLLPRSFRVYLFERLLRAIQKNNEERSRHILYKISYWGFGVV
jgi:hypothetical protein